MLFFYYLDINCSRSIGLRGIQIPQWMVRWCRVNATSAELGSDWFESGVRHEEFKSGDYGTGSSKYCANGVRKLIGYVMLYCVEAENFQEFEEYVEKTHPDGILEKTVRYMNQLGYGMKIEYYMVGSRP